MKKILVGSKAFFPNAGNHDTDWVYIDNNNQIEGRIPIGENDYFLYNDKPKEEWISRCKDPVQIGKFLVPEFVEYIQFTIDDLKNMNELFDKLCDKYKYQKKIRDYYLENNAFVLTEEQRNEAYKLYKQYR